ncbi:MAG: ATP-binding protein, partial [Desulfobacterales bacterium]
MSNGSTHLTITVDKSHIISLGERLYEQSIELIRELVNNAFDADATRVDVTISGKEIVVADNGEGMDMAGLEQYFNVGSDAKLLHPKSPRFGRDRIGQFGIGKFASLAAASRFEITTQKEGFCARVVFDRTRWLEQGDSWVIPLTRLEPDPVRGNGTTVRLVDLKRVFNPEDVTRRIAEGVPIRAKNFAVYVNRFRVAPRRWPGNRMPVMEGTKYGIIHGEIVILPASQASTENMGIEIKVKGATVRRELFNIAAWGKAATRIRGEIHADFLPLTSDRSGFMEDTPEFETFLKGMQKVIGDVEKVYKQLASRRENQKVSRALKEALQRVYQALSLNPDLSPFGAVPLAEKDRRRVGDETAVESGTMDQAPEQIKPRDETPSNSDQGEELSSAPEDKPKKVRKPSLRVATPNAVVKRLKFGETGVTCCLDHLGEDGPECITEGTIIYINRDHPLYKRESRKKEAHILNIARLITQEISLMKDSAN